MSLKKVLSIFLLIPLLLSAKIEFTPYGFVLLDIEYNSKEVGSLPSPSPRAVPLNSDTAAQHGQTLIDARESRIGLIAKDRYKEIDLMGLVEADFYTVHGTAIENGRLLRLRHFYAKGTLPSSFFLLIGQTWSLFMNSEIAQPDLVDFIGPVGSVYNREPQLRAGYLHHLGGKNGDLLLEASLEKQSLSEEGVSRDDIHSSVEQGAMLLYPLFVGKASWLMKNLQWELAVCGSQDRVTINSHGSKRSKGAWGVESSAQYRYKRLTLQGSVSHEDGVNRLIVTALFPDVALDSANHLHTISSNNWYAGFRWDFTKKTSLNAVYGWSHAHRAPHTDFTGTDRALYQSMHLNLLHKFWKDWKVGFELQRIDVKALNGDHGDVNIAHVGIWYYF